MRKEKKIIVDDRGNELTFIIREMPALRLESWIIRIGLLLAESGVVGDLISDREPLDVASVIQSARSLATMDAAKLLRSLGALDYARIEPLLHDLLDCCSVVAGKQMQPLSPENVDGIISDIRTLFTLQKEALALNLGFFGGAGPSGSETPEEAAQASSGRKISVRSQPS